ncbi:hypothetical protein ACS2B2_25755 [Bacillus cereus group sp. BceL297]|uniref:hypothetical protein n=1 Tax=unclassified Bacillus cereus group TaxID=2750818 RepID=UPI003F25ACC8
MALTVKEAFEVLRKYGITKNEEIVRRWLRNGKLKGIAPAPDNPRGGWTIEIEELQAFIDKRTPKIVKVKEQEILENTTKVANDVNVEELIRQKDKEIAEITEKLNAVNIEKSDEGEDENFSEILDNIPSNIRKQIYKYFESLYLDKIKEKEENTRFWYEKHEGLLKEISVLKDDIRKLEKGVRPLKNEDFYPIEKNMLHVNVFGENKQVNELFSDLKTVKGYDFAYLEDGFKDKKREQKYAKLSVKNKKKQVIHVPKGSDWMTKAWTIEIIRFREEKSYTNPGEKDYNIGFRYKGIGLEFVTFSYNFKWTDWDGLKREENIDWWVDQDKAEMSKQTENALDNRFKYPDERIKNKIRGILERKLEKIDEYKMFVPFVFVD